MSMDESKPDRAAVDERIADFSATLAAMGIQPAEWAREYLTITTEQLPQLLGPSGAIVLVAYSPQVGVVVSMGASVGRHLSDEDQREVMENLLTSGLERVRDGGSGEETIKFGFDIQGPSAEPED